MTRRIIKPNVRNVIFDKAFLVLSLLAMGLLFFASLAVYLVEKGQNPMIVNYFDSLWWGVATITTIGFGDIVPITSAGRTIGIFLMLTGPVLFVLFTGALLRVLIQEEVSREISPLDHEIQKEEQSNRAIIKTLAQIEERLRHLEKK